MIVWWLGLLIEGYRGGIRGELFMMVLFVAVFVLFPVSRVVWILFQISKICIVRNEDRLGHLVKYLS